MTIAPMIGGPDPNTRTPVFKLPPDACDSHCHIFGPADRYPYAPGRSYTPPDAPLEMFAALQAKLGIDRAVIVNASCHGDDNRPVTDAIAQSGGRYRGIANVSESTTDRELQDLHEAGIDGCRFAFLKRLGTGADMAGFHRIVERIAPMGWHVDIYLDPGTVAAFAPMLTKLPISYVIDHMGTLDASHGMDQPNFTALLDLLRSDEKCWVKVTGLERASASGAPFDDAVLFAARLVETAPDRVLWGTDWPHPNLKRMPNDADLVDAVPRYAANAALRQKLLVDNPSRLFGFQK
jgi:predicted TIM-barrel fold metal-dependent hydrolase